MRSAAAAKWGSRSARTRERILATSLALFNAEGEANVTTGDIADELNISPGNLYYHFRNKEEIIRHLFAEFERRIDVDPGEIFEAGNAIEDLWLYLHLMFEQIWAFRFLYRNLDDLLTRDARLRDHFLIIIGHKRDAVLTICRALVTLKAMKATDDEIAALAENILVVASYWLNYEHLRGTSGSGVESQAGSSQHLARGVFQVMALIAPFLRNKERMHLDYLKKIYLS